MRIEDENAAPKSAVVPYSDLLASFPSVGPAPTTPVFFADRAHNREIRWATRFRIVSGFTRATCNRRLFASDPRHCHAWSAARQDTTYAHIEICSVLVSMLMGEAAIAQNLTTTHQQLTQLAEDIVYTSARLFPTQATPLGITNYDGELESPSEKDRSAYIAQLRKWRKRLHGIVPTGESNVSLIDRNDARLMGAQLAQNLNALRVYQVDRYPAMSRHRCRS